MFGDYCCGVGVDVGRARAWGSEGTIEYMLDVETVGAGVVIAVFGGRGRGDGDRVIVCRVKRLLRRGRCGFDYHRGGARRGSRRAGGGGGEWRRSTVPVIAGNGGVVEVVEVVV